MFGDMSGNGERIKGINTAPGTRCRVTRYAV